MKKTKAFPFVVLSLIFLSGCGGATASKAKTVNLQVKGDIQTGLELCEVGEYKAALAEFKAVAEKEKTWEAEIRVGFGLFLLGRYQESASAYRQYLNQHPDLSEMDRREFEYDADRIERALRDGEQLKGESLASRRLRGELAKVRAEKSLGEGDFEQAFKQYRTASQYLPDPNLALEAGLAATESKNYNEANVQFSLFLGLMGERLDPNLRQQINGEIERIRAVMQGDRSVSTESLADRIYAARKTGGAKTSPGSAESMPAQPAAWETGIEKAETTGTGGAAALDTAGSPVLESEGKPAEKPPEKAISKREERLRQKEKLIAKKIAEKAFREAERKAAFEEQKQNKQDLVAKAKARKEATAASQKAAARPRAEQTESPPSGKQEAKAELKTLAPSAQPPETALVKTRFDELVSQLQSNSSATRGDVIKALTAIKDPRVDQILQDRMLLDNSIQVRMAAVDGLVARKSINSIPYMRQALMTVSNSSERSKVRMAIRKLMGTD